MKQVMIMGVILALLGTAACSKRKPLLVPLGMIGPHATPQVVTLTEQGTQAFNAKQFEAAKKYFEHAVSVAPQSGQAHYNYALALNALGNLDLARQHFLEAANLAPGDTVIWNSPVLEPHGNPDTKMHQKDRPYGTRPPRFGANPLPRF